MIPKRLTLSGFLSYRDEVTIDFTTFHLACISGANGAGKSSLLDAITYALFGKARQSGEAIINTHREVTAAQVTFEFEYEGNVYRVQRTNPRGKTALLEFHILTPEGGWKPLTERTSRETQQSILKTLRMDYETFVNAAFFLQGNADQFTQQRPGDRKRILGTILGLEIWETYRQETARRRKGVEADITNLEGRLQEIKAELNEEEERKARLKTLRRDLKRLEKTRRAQETALENMRRIAATLTEQQKLVDTLFRQLEAANHRLEKFKDRLAARARERDAYAEIIARAPAVQEAYLAWQEARSRLAEWDEISARFNEQEKRRFEPINRIDNERVRLETERKSLFEKKVELDQKTSQLAELQTDLNRERQALHEAETQLETRAGLDTRLQTALQNQAEAKAENPRLRDTMRELKDRIDQLKRTEGADCPLCGQPLSADDRLRLIDDLEKQGKEMGDRYRENKKFLKEAGELVSELQSQIAGLQMAEEQARAHSRKVDQLKSRIEQIQAAQKDWEADQALLLAEIEEKLAHEDFALEARATLAEIDAGLKAIGYDAAAHDEARRIVAKGRAVEEEKQALDKAQAAHDPLDREIAELETQITGLKTDIARQQKEHDNAAASLAAAQAQAPDLDKAERELMDLQEQENQLRIEVGAARQKVLVLEDLKSRSQQIEVERDALAQKVTRFKQLERAFGKDGVPALLIEQALPQIEAKANEILDRLSGGSMSVRFLTQRKFKDKRREDLRETLDIQISDAVGDRDYEMYSGGEAFRINFAIRLALSEVLSQRAGARLQTLVIDEGFGSQDAVGRQRLIEAINMVQPDFAKILVITHIDELKDAFPNRIDVEKGVRGSMVTVV